MFAVVVVQSDEMIRAHPAFEERTVALMCGRCVRPTRPEFESSNIPCHTSKCQFAERLSIGRPDDLSYITNVFEILINNKAPNTNPNNLHNSETNLNIFYDIRVNDK
jgi:hypothetical protein